ncbi:MAG: Smr/MutS family protein [Flammeovirgaceae bacterium]|nr:Smr/MutS family protein [Flammeovirgaceae bacterium]
MQVYPINIEQRLEVDEVRHLIKGFCQIEAAQKLVDKALPSVSYTVIQEKLAETAEMLKILTSETPYPKEALEDIHPLLVKIKVKGSFLKPEDFYLLSRGNRILSRWKLFLHQHQTVYPTMATLTSGFESNEALSDQIDAVIDERGEVRDAASPALAKIRQEMVKAAQRVRKSIRSVLEKVKKDNYTDGESQITIREGRLVIPVRAEFKRKVSGFVHDESSTGHTVYMEPTEVLTLNNEVRELGYQEQREVLRILTKLSDITRSHLVQLTLGAGFVRVLDFIKAKAKFAKEFGGSVPILSKTPGTKLIKAVHPLLWKVNHEQKKPVIPLNLELSHQTHRFLIISGPNAGGKSVAMKTAGLLQYMVQCGFPVTVDESAVFGIFDRIFLDIGDAQSLENDLSTYSSRLTAMKYFSEFADRKTLVLMDEFGTGTEPQFGGAIAEALLDRLLKQQSYGIITTHYANIKKYADTAPGMVNGAMRYDTEKLLPLYQLEIGKPGSSFALEIARKIGLPAGLIDYAKSKIGSSQVDYDKMLTELEGDKTKYERLNKALEFKELQLKDLRKDYLALKEMVESDKRRIIQEAKLEAGRIIEGANKQIEKVIRDIKETNADKEAALSGRQTLADLKAKLAVQSAKKMTLAAAISVGDQVRIKDQEGSGSVLQVKGKRAQVAFGGLTSLVSLEQLEKIGTSSSTNQSLKHIGGLNLAQRQKNFKFELDLRGKRVEEVLGLLDNFMDDALLLGTVNLRIIHGKGHGVLREVVRNHLTSYPSVRKLQDEHIERGGSGVTLVDLG